MISDDEVDDVTMGGAVAVTSAAVVLVVIIADIGGVGIGGICIGDKGVDGTISGELPHIVHDVFPG